MHCSSLRSFQSHQEHILQHFGSVDLTTRKQNKLPSFIDRFVQQIHIGQDRYDIILIMYNQLKN
jgi:hypothetical protein